MARPGSVEVGGYFPTPDSVLPQIASLVSWPDDRRHGVVLDPCAGDGGAVLALRDAWSAPGVTRSSLAGNPLWRPDSSNAIRSSLESPSSRSRVITLWRNSVSAAAVLTNGIGTNFPSASHPPRVATACT
jgi:hypothetical protein